MLCIVTMTQKEIMRDAKELRARNQCMYRDDKRLCIVTMTLKELSSYCTTNVMYRDSKGDYERYKELLHETNVMYRDQKEIIVTMTLKVATARNQCYVS